LDGIKIKKKEWDYVFDEDLGFKKNLNVVSFILVTVAHAEKIPTQFFYKLND